MANTVADIAEALFAYKLKAVSGTFDLRDFEGGDFSISINPGKNIVSVIPVIAPGQFAMLSVGAPVKELVMDEHKQVIEKSFLYLGLAYDHRVINGQDASRFMDEIVERMERYTADEAETI